MKVCPATVHYVNSWRPHAPFPNQFGGCDTRVKRRKRLYIHARVLVPIREKERERETDRQTDRDRVIKGGSNLSDRSLFARRVPRRACSEKMGRATGRKICTDRQTDEYRDTSAQQRLIHNTIRIRTRGNCVPSRSNFVF